MEYQSVQSSERKYLTIQSIYQLTHIFASFAKTSTVYTRYDLVVRLSLVHMFVSLDFKNLDSCDLVSSGSVIAGHLCLYNQGWCHLIRYAEIWCLSEHWNTFGAACFAIWNTMPPQNILDRVFHNVTYQLRYRIAMTCERASQITFV